MEALLKQRAENKKKIEEFFTQMTILKDKNKEIDAEILPKLKTEDGAKLTMRYEDMTVSIASRKGIKIINEKVASMIIPEDGRENYYRLDRIMFAQLAKDYIKEKGEVPNGLEEISSEYLLVKEVKQTNK